MTRIKNRLRTMVQYNLPHDACCSGAVCLCTRKEVLVYVRNSDGSIGQQFRNQRLCASLILAGGERSAPVSDAVLAAPEIVTAVARRELTIIRTND